jgi:hypothetical protein
MNGRVARQSGRSERRTAAVAQTDRTDRVDDGRM